MSCLVSRFLDMRRITCAKLTFKELKNAIDLKTDRFSVKTEMLHFPNLYKEGGESGQEEKYEHLIFHNNTENHYSPRFLNKNTDSPGPTFAPLIKIWKI